MDDLTAAELREHLEAMAEQGFVERHPTEDKYRLTPAGIARAQELEGEQPSQEKHYLDQLVKSMHHTRDPHAPLRPIDGGRRRPR